MPKMIPAEVKAEENLNAKSLKTMLGTYPDAAGIRLSMSGYREEESFVNVPLYMVEPWFQKLDEAALSL